MSTTIMLIGMGLGVVVAALLILAAKPRPQVSVTIRELDAKARQPYVEKEEWSRCIYTAGSDQMVCLVRSGSRRG